MNRKRNDRHVGKTVVYPLIIVDIVLHDAGIPGTTVHGGVCKCDRTELEVLSTITEQAPCVSHGILGVGARIGGGKYASVVRSTRRSIDQIKYVRVGKTIDLGSNLIEGIPLIQ